MTERSTRLLKATAVLACVALLGACSTPRRSPERRDPAQLFTSADANGDGVITRAEFVAARAANFGKYDRNSDGFIDSADFPKRIRARNQVGERIDGLIARLDGDRDGRVSRAEFVDGPTAIFDRVDANHDGELSRDEVAAAKAAMKGSG
jgi:hypothetical protein